jgi:hypothetical protein
MKTAGVVYKGKATARETIKRHLEAQDIPEPQLAARPHWPVVVTLLHKFPVAGRLNSRDLVLNRGLGLTHDVLDRSLGLARSVLNRSLRLARSVLNRGLGLACHGRDTLKRRLRVALHSVPVDVLAQVRRRISKSGRHTNYAQNSISGQSAEM